ncbi:GyrI-like domain-containing protein [Pedobacter sp. ASV1-7]|uniref:GyrI-like domain-containing protein n=1 Tax=Pedobacter sp. ASV1-7 TaxID=3145237 RepID=UPI0032E8E64C
METQVLRSFPVIGIKVRTSNAEGKASIDIPALWERFWTTDVAAKVPGRINNDIYSVYTEYEGNYTQPYTTLIGYKVEDLDYIPEGLTGIMIKEGTYLKCTAKGKLSEGIVFDAWTDIWNSQISRAYTTDFEVYDERSGNPDAAEIDIFLAVRP